MSFSPPPSRWDFRFQSDGLQYGSHDGFQLYGSSTSANSKESKSWVRGNMLYNNQYSASDSTGMFLSSPSDRSQGPQWTPPPIQEITIDDYVTPTQRDSILRKFSFTPAIEGTPANVDSRVSTSSCSDNSESEPRFKSCISSHCNLTSRLSFISKPIYPLSFPTQTTIRASIDSESTVLLDHDSSTPQREPHRWSTASSSIDFVDVSEPLESEGYGRSKTSSNTCKCGLCERFLSQRSPWSSRRIVRTGDMPVVGVLSCRHVFHAECLEQTTPKMQKSEPSCPLCLKLQEENSLDQQVFSRMRNGFPRLESSCEDGQSRAGGCAQVGDCVEGALQVPPRSTMLLLNRNRIKQNFSLKSNSSKEFPGKFKKTGSYSSQLFSGKSNDQRVVGCSKTIAGPRI